MYFSLCLVSPPPRVSYYPLLHVPFFFVSHVLSSFSTLLFPLFIFFSSFLFLSSISLSFFFRRREGSLLDKAETQK